MHRAGRAPGEGGFERELGREEPQIRGTVITVFVTILITVMKIFDVIYVMTNGAFNTNVVGLEFFNQLYTNYNYGYASAIVVMLLIAIVPIMIYQIRHFRAEEAA